MPEMMPSSSLRTSSGSSLPAFRSVYEPCAGVRRRVGRRSRSFLMAPGRASRCAPPPRRRSSRARRGGRRHRGRRRPSPWCRRRPGRWSRARRGRSRRRPLRPTATASPLVPVRSAGSRERGGRCRRAASSARAPSVAQGRRRRCRLGRTPLVGGLVKRPPPATSPRCPRRQSSRRQKRRGRPRGAGRRQRPSVPSVAGGGAAGRAAAAAAGPPAPRPTGRRRRIGRGEARGTSRRPSVPRRRRGGRSVAALPALQREARRAASGPRCEGCREEVVLRVRRVATGRRAALGACGARERGARVEDVADVGGARSAAGGARVPMASQPVSSLAAQPSSTGRTARRRARSRSCRGRGRLAHASAAAAAVAADAAAEEARGDDVHVGGLGRSCQRRRPQPMMCGGRAAARVGAGGDGGVDVVVVVEHAAAVVVEDDPSHCMAEVAFHGAGLLDRGYADEVAATVAVDVRVADGARRRARRGGAASWDRPMSESLSLLLAVAAPPQHAGPRRRVEEPVAAQVGVAADARGGGAGMSVLMARRTSPRRRRGSEKSVATPGARRARARRRVAPRLVRATRRRVGVVAVADDRVP